MRVHHASGKVLLIGWIGRLRENFRTPRIAATKIAATKIAATKRESAATVPLFRLRSWPKKPPSALPHRPGRACSSPVVTGYPKAGRTWWPRLHAVVLWTPGIAATGHRFPGV